MLSVLVPIAAVLFCAVIVVGSSGPTVPLRVRRIIAFGPALAWGVVVTLSLGFAFALPMHSQSSSTLLVALCFAGVGVWSASHLVNACREALSDPLEPLFRTRPRFIPRAKQPLTDAEQNLARDWLSAFENAGLLEAGEVTLSAVLDRCEHDEQSAYGLDDFLNALSGAKPQYAHLAFFHNGVEFSYDDAKDIVMQLARLAGREVQGVQLEHLAPIREDRGQESLATFDLEGQSQQIGFVMYAKALPWDLIEEISRLMILEEDERRFEVTWSETVAMLTPVSREQKTRLEALFGQGLFGDIR